MLSIVKLADDFSGKARWCFHGFRFVASAGKKGAMATRDNLVEYFIPESMCASNSQQTNKNNTNDISTSLARGAVF